MAGFNPFCSKFVDIRYNFPKFDKNNLFDI